MDGKSLMESIRQTIDHLNKPNDPYKRKVLIGGPNQIEEWKKIYGDTVDYIENAMIKR